MVEDFGLRSLPYFGLVAVVIIWAILGAIVFLLFARKAKQSWLAFFGRYGFWFFFLFFSEALLLYTWPGFHGTTRCFAATLVGGILSLAGVGHSVSGSTLSLQNPHLAFDITAACLGGMLFWMYIALVLAESQATVKQQLLGILVGLAILVLFNFFRITLSIYLEWRTGVHVHDYFMLFNTVFVLLVWVVWLRILRRMPPRPGRLSTSA